MKGTKTDKVFANTTEIYKFKAASDVQVLAELESEYGIGDVVRISDAPPAPTTVPLTRTTSISTEKKPLPTIPKANATTITPPLSKEALVITSGTYKSDIEMPEKKVVAETIALKATESPVERKTKAYSPPLTLLPSSRSGVTVKSLKSTKSYKNNSSSNKKFLFFFKKTSKKTAKRAKLKDNSKFGCYKF